MKRFVFWTGIYNLGASAVLLVPGALAMNGLPEPASRAWAMLPGLMLVFLGIMLILCSRDLARRGALVFWEGLLRLAVFVLLAGYGLFGGFGPMAVVIGSIDLVVGLIYVVGLPRALGRSAWDLLRDAPA